MQDQGLLSYVNKVIHSLVVSEPLRMTVDQLKRDYVREEGTTIPFRKLGFRDAESFLLSIPDTITLFGSGPLAEVRAKTNAKTAHIQNLVQSQKKPSKRPRNRYASKPRFANPPVRSNLVFVNEHAHANNYNHRYQNNNYNRQTYFGARNGSNHIEGKHSGRASQKAADTQPNTAEHTSSMCKSFANIQIRSVDDDISSDEQSEYDIYVPERGTQSETAEKNMEIPLKTQPYIEYVSSGEGSDEGAIPLYAVDDKVLNYKHTDTEDVDLTHVDSYEGRKAEQAACDWYSSDEGNDDEAIPINAVDEYVMSVDYPQNTVRFDQKLPCRDIRQTLILENRAEVQLVTILGPHNFYFWLHDEKLNDYKAMNSNMQNFYSSIDLASFTIPLFFIMAGHLGAFLKNSIWHRVQVSNIKTDDTQNIEVELVDTGERTWICHTDLKYLTKEFATLPPQCWRGRLAYVAPRHGHSFSAHASNYFFDLVCFRRLFAKFEKITEEDNTAYMVLVDPVPKFFAKNINLVLIDSGNVRHCFHP